MKRLLLVCALALVALPPAMAQLATTRFINLVDRPATITYSSSGTAVVPLDPSVGNIINITGYRKLSLMVGSTRATSMSVNIGKGHGATMMQGFTRPIGATIQTFDVIGPELSLWLKGGAPGTTERVQIWVYLSS